MHAKAELKRAPSVPGSPGTVFDLGRCYAAQHGSQVCTRSHKTARSRLHVVVGVVHRVHGQAGAGLHTVPFDSLCYMQVLNLEEEIV